MTWIQELQTLKGRVKQMELFYDQLQNYKNMEDYEVDCIYKILSSYMDSGQWLSDYEADEQGEIPENVKRGVLSEDGLFNLLTEIQEKTVSKRE